MRIIAVIPARGGSKSIPRKNIKHLLGHPLIAYSIAAGLKSNLIDKVICSTDDHEIADVARKYGADVPFMRPDNISQDTTTDYPVFEHILNQLKDELSNEDLMVHLRPTSPFRPPELIDEGIALLQADSDADSVRSISESIQNPYKTWTVQGDVIRPIIETGQYESYNMPRQLLPKTYWHNGVLDIVTVNCLRTKGSMSGNRILPIFVDTEYAIDLDTEQEWKAAESVMTQTTLPYIKP